jgi:C-terminal processing protease CtpA/Prc
MRTSALPRFLSQAAILFFILFALLISITRHAHAQTFTGTDRERARTMLGMIKDDVKKYYYDPTYHGINIDEHFRAADEKLKQATSNSRAFRIIAQALIDFEDSHLFFEPPGRAVQVDYGWEMTMFGDKCYITAVEPGSDADAKKLKPGDEVVSIDGYEPTRRDMWKMKYFYYRLNPKQSVRLVVRDPNGAERQLDVLAKLKEGKKVVDLNDPDTWVEMEREAENDLRIERHRYYEQGGLYVWRMPAFDMEASEVDGVMRKAKKFDSLIIDLRQNYGGSVDMLQRLVGYFFDHDVKVADLKGRKEMKPVIAKTRGGDVYKGKVVVLLDSESSSASEVFARVMQLEKRGIVLGDRSAGTVMRTRYYGHQAGVDVVVYYGANITDADLIMTDGNSLERIGVTPDESVLPTAQDMVAKRDPVLARAAALVGVELKPEKAGGLFPIEWRK